MASELGVQTIQHTNGTDALVISSTGDVTMPNRKLYHFQLRRGAGDVGVNTDVVWNIEDQDPEGIHDASTGIITIPVTGVWQLNLQAITGGNGGNTAMSLRDESNVVINEIATLASGDWYENLSCSFALKLDAGQQIKWRVTAGSIYANTGQGMPQFSGYLIG